MTYKIYKLDVLKLKYVFLESCDDYNKAFEKCLRAGYYITNNKEYLPNLKLKIQ